VLPKNKTVGVKVIPQLTMPNPALPMKNFGRNAETPNNFGEAGVDLSAENR
jgi:hypothetical protein